MPGGGERAGLRRVDRCRQVRRGAGTHPPTNCRFRACAAGSARTRARPRAAGHRPMVSLRNGPQAFRGRLGARAGCRSGVSPPVWRILPRARAGRPPFQARCTGKVAVIGAGPAGLACAYQLREEGLRRHRFRGAAGGRRHDGRRHPGVPAAARHPCLRDRSASAGSAWRSSPTARSAATSRSTICSARVTGRIPRYRRPPRPEAADAG